MRTCCFLGHREIKDSCKLETKLYEQIEGLIVSHNVCRFLLGSNSQFNELCYSVLTRLKEKYPDIRRVYVRAEYADIDEKYMEYLLKRYEETYYSEELRRSGKAVYVERNYEMIDNSHFCIVYYDENYFPKKRRRKKSVISEYQPQSGTKLAYDYALNKKKEIINMFEKIT